MISLLKRLFKLRSSPFCITEEDLAFYNAEGYLILKGIFEEQDLQLFHREIDAIWRNRKKAQSPFILDFCEGPYNGQRIKLADAPENSRKYSYKLNDLYLESEQCRNVCLHPSLANTLRKLLNDDPAIINGLNFKKGSQQDDHFDTYFMPSPTLGRMAVTSICLEDISPEAGPVQYYPRSHLIPPYRFQHGGIHVTNPAEREKARAYIDSKIRELNLKPETYLGKRGDVLIWHGQLYHGGTPIKDPERTRKTIVTHYWGASDLTEQQRARHANGAYYYKRPHPQLPANYTGDIQPNP